jgi:hypothetical protein
MVVRPRSSTGVKLKTERRRFELLRPLPTYRFSKPAKANLSLPQILYLRMVGCPACHPACHLTLKVAPNSV